MNRKQTATPNLTGLRRLVRFWAGVLLLLLSTRLLYAAPANNDLNWWVIGSGGDRISSSGNTMQGTLSQPLSGPAMAAGENTVCSGFWCNRASPFACYDLNGDGQVTITDVQAVAGKWRLRAGDAGWVAGYDVDGDGVISVRDIQKVAAQLGRVCS